MLQKPKLKAKGVIPYEKNALTDEKKTRLTKCMEQIFNEEERL